jgi:hypothetical protein
VQGGGNGVDTGSCQLSAISCQSGGALCVGKRVAGLTGDAVGVGDARRSIDAHVDSNWETPATTLRG